MRYYSRYLFTRAVGSDMADMGDTASNTVRRKKGNKVSLSVNVTKKEKRTREVVGADIVKDVKGKEDTVTDNVEQELTEKLASLLERDRSGVSGWFCNLQDLPVPALWFA